MGLSLTQLAVTVTEADDYMLARGYAGWSDTDFVKEEALRRGQDYVAGRFNGRWRPEFENDAAPDAVKMAIFEAAIREKRAPGSLSPDYDPSAQIKREKFGPLETEYATPATAWAYQPVFGIIDRLLAGLVGSGAGGVNFRVSRA